MQEELEPIAGFPPYQRGYRVMGYLQTTPTLRVVTINSTSHTETHTQEAIFTNVKAFAQSDFSCKSLLIDTIAQLPAILNHTQAQYFYIPASILLQNKISKETVASFCQDDRLRILLYFQEDVFKSMEQLRALRALKLPITCFIHSFTEHLYALIAQTDDLVCDIKNKELASPENQLLIKNSLIMQTVDPFFKY